MVTWADRPTHTMKTKAISENGLSAGCFALVAGMMIALCAGGAAAFGQNAGAAATPANSSGSSGAATLRVIVPWTHFKPSGVPATADAGNDPQLPPQASGQELVSPQLTTTGLPQAGSGGPSGADPNQSSTTTAPGGDAVSRDHPANAAGPPTEASEAAASGARSQQLYEEDISKKHPHPPEPVKLPPADQIATPLSDSEEPAPPTAIQNPPQSQTEASGANTGQSQGTPGAATAAAQSPEAQIASLAAAYANRRQDREAKLKSLHAAGANGPAAQTGLEIKETKLELEGEQDRMQTGRQLSKQFALLADELDARAVKVSKMADDRKQTALSAQAAIDQTKDLLPRRELALRNLAALPANSGNDQMIEDLKTEITREEAAQRLDGASAREAGEEADTLSSEAAAMSQEAAKARRRSATYAAIAQNAQANQDRLADRMEYDLARSRSAGMLAGVSKVIDPAPALQGIAAPSMNPSTPSANGAQGGPPPAAPASAPTDADSLRDCLRKTGKVDACLAQQGVS